MKQPHLLLISVDHWPGSLLGAASHPAIQTPTLDQLARSGVRFENAYSECPVCIPARRTLLTGNPPREHGDRTFQTQLPLPSSPTVSQVLRNAGYHTNAVGKLHVYPPRARAGFDEVILCEEGRPQLGAVDDYEIYLGEQGRPGWQFLHGMSNNDYVHRPWHLEEEHHVTNWITRQMCRTIQRRDPTKPGFWYLSYTHPHPPLAPLPCYWDMYRDVDPGEPYHGDWRRNADTMPAKMNAMIETRHYSPEFIRNARRAFYALCTHIDHQLRLVIGTLREEGLLEDTVILFTSDHGDMLGNHGLWAKRLFYEDSACVPMILSAPSWLRRVGQPRVDSRLVGLQDIAPTLLDLAGVQIPPAMHGQPMLGAKSREWLYGEYGEGFEATRMLRGQQYKLIYYAAGNRLQLFDLKNDPQELTDLADRPAYQDIQQRMTELLVRELYGSDHRWAPAGRLVGLPDSKPASGGNRELALQRGLHWPSPTS